MFIRSTIVIVSLFCLGAYTQSTGTTTRYWYVHVFVLHMTIADVQ